MKKYFLLLASAALLLVGCAKEKLSIESGADEMVTVTFTTSLDKGVATKAVADGDGAAANVNRCIMEIYYGDELFTRQYAPVGSDKKASFTTQIVSNRTYKVAFWADMVDDATTDVGLAKDKYYNTASLKEIAIRGNYSGNDDARDAFYHVGQYTIAQAGSSFGDIKLKRPFAQMNVITTDWDKASSATGLAPEKVKVTLKNALVKFNAVTEVASGSENLEYEAAVYTAPAPVDPVSTTEKTLSMDYLFASADKAVIDIDWKALHGSDIDVAHTFAAVPYQRNFRTNIKGALLTTQGQWTVEVDPIWSAPEYNVPFYVASSIQDAQEYISTTNQDKSKAVDLSKAEIKQSDVNQEDGTIHFILKTTSPQDLVNFTLPAIPTGVSAAGWTIEYQEGYPTENVGVNAPEGTKVKILAPTSHVNVTGTSYAEIEASTGDNTLVIPEDVTVAELKIVKGGLEIHGTVAAATVTGTKETVFVRECENLSQTVYEALKGYIAPNYIGVKNTDNSWNIELEDFWPNFAATEFSAIDQSAKTLTISTPAELALLAKNINGGTSYAGYAISISGNLDMSAHYWVPINARNSQLSGSTIKGSGNAVISNLKIEKSVYSGNYNYYAGFIAQSVGALTIKDITFTSAVSVDNGSGVAIVLGLTYGNTLFENVKVLNSTVSAATKAGALVGFTGGNNATVTVKDCALKNVTVKAEYSYALMVGLVNTTDHVIFEGNNTVVNSHAVLDEDVAATDMPERKTIKGYEYGVDETKLWVVGVQDAWAECRTNPTPKKNVDGVEYSVMGDIFYHADGEVVDVCAPDPVAKIGKTKYSTLAAALEAATDNDVVVMCMDIIKEVKGDNSDRETYLVSNKSITLDLNGHTIKHRYGLNKYGMFEVKNSTLFIDDSSVEKNGKIADTYAQAVLYSENSNVNLKNGILAAEYSSTSSTNYRVVKLKNSTFTMDGGSVLAATTGSYNRAFEFVHSTGTNSKVIVNNGVIRTYTSYAVVFYGDSGGYQGENNTVEINGGEISTEGNYGWLGDDLFGEIVMNDGSFTSNWHQVVDTNTKFTHNGGTVNIKSK